MTSMQHMRHLLRSLHFATSKMAVTSALKAASMYIWLWRQHCIHLHGNTVTVRAGAGNGGKISYKMDWFVINFGDLSLDEYLEEGEKNQTTKKERFVPMSHEELNQLELSRNEQTTSRSTSWAVRCFQEYLKSSKQDVDFFSVTKEELNRILCEFYGSTRNSQGQYYSISDFKHLQTSIKQFK